MYEIVEYANGNFTLFRVKKTKNKDAKWWHWNKTKVEMIPIQRNITSKDNALEAMRREIAAQNPKKVMCRTRYDEYGDEHYQHFPM